MPRGASYQNSKQTSPEAEDEAGAEDGGDPWEQEGDGRGVAGGEDAPACPAAVVFWIWNWRKRKRKEEEKRR